MKSHRRRADGTPSAVDEVGGGPDLVLVDGQDLLGPQDADGLSVDGVHPSDLGFQRIADRLLPLVQAALRR